MNTEKTRKPRKLKKTLVQVETENTCMWDDTDCTALNTEDAMDWIKKMGVAGYKYRVITVQFEGKLTRTPVTIEKVSFV